MWYYLNPFNYFSSYYSNTEESPSSPPPIAQLGPIIINDIMVSNPQVENIPKDNCLLENIENSGVARNAPSVSEVNKKIITKKHLHISQSDIENILNNLKKTPPKEPKVFPKRPILREIDEFFIKKKLD